MRSDVSKLSTGNARVFDEIAKGRIEADRPVSSRALSLSLHSQIPIKFLLEA